jgi:hypothetical protein
MPIEAFRSARPSSSFWRQSVKRTELRLHPWQDREFYEKTSIGCVNPSWILGVRLGHRRGNPNVARSPSRNLTIQQHHSPLLSSLHPTRARLFLRLRAWSWRDRAINPWRTSSTYRVPLWPVAPHCRRAHAWQDPWSSSIAWGNRRAHTNTRAVEHTQLVRGPSGPTHFGFFYIKSKNKWGSSGNKVSSIKMGYVHRRNDYIRKRHRLFSKRLRLTKRLGSDTNWESLDDA